MIVGTETGCSTYGSGVVFQVCSMIPSMSVIARRSDVNVKCTPASVIPSLRCNPNQLLSQIDSLPQILPEFAGRNWKTCIAALKPLN